MTQMEAKEQTRVYICLATRTSQEDWNDAKSERAAHGCVAWTNLILKEGDALRPCGRKNGRSIKEWVCSLERVLRAFFPECA